MKASELRYLASVSLDLARELQALAERAVTTAHLVGQLHDTLAEGATAAEADEVDLELTFLLREGAA